MNMMKSTAERIAEENAAAIAAGKDPFGDDDPITPEGFEDGQGTAKDAEDNTADADADADAGNEDGAPKDASTESAGTSAEEQGTQDAAAQSAESVTQAAAHAEPAPSAPAGPSAEELAAKLDKLLDSKAEVETKWATGEIDDGERAKQIREIDRQAMAVNRQLAVAEAEQVREAEAANAAIREIKAQAISQGIDYDKHPAAAKQFDMAMTMLEADPGNAKLTVQQLIQKAHASVLALNGIQPAGKDANPAATTGKAKTKPPIPPTLRGLPAAAVQSSGSSLAEQMSRLKGAAYQEAFNKLSSAQRAELMGD